jgi:methionyl-tRNA formyltransferase
MALRILFFGTPAFAVPSLQALLDSPHEVVGVVTQPDRRRGRGHHVVPGPVKELGTSAGVPILQPERLKDDATQSAIRALNADLAVVAAYGKILPQALLDVPRLGMINVHASLLPRWRGAAPVHRAILAGDAVTGVTIMRVVFALDAGPMLASVATPIGLDETSRELESRLAHLGASALVETVGRLADGPVHDELQDETLVTYAARLERGESRIDWRQSAEAIHNQIRGLQPWPLAGAMIQARRVMFLKSTVLHQTDTTGAPGAIVSAGRGGLDVATGVGTLRILELQEAGRPVMSAAAYLNGRRLSAGDEFAPLPDGTS